VTKRIERPATIGFAGAEGEAGLALDGLFVGGEQGPAGAGGVVAPPHPLYGGSMESPVVTELADALFRAGASSLRFNWRGVGASAGEPSGEPQHALGDYRAALAHLRDSVEGPLVACGYSFGAIAALLAGGADARVRRLLLVAPPPAMLDRGALEAFPGDVFIAVGERDALADARELGALAESLDRAHFVAIPDTDHFFLQGLALLGRSAGAWLASPPAG